jgi:Preprotein translocase subunit SecD
MTLLEILLILIGIAVIIISCFIVDKSKKKGNEFDGAYPVEMTEEEKKQLKAKMESLMTELSEEIIDQTKDTLGKLSNEKIIAVDEFSNQIIEKISQNHEEVLFLYDMLNEKEAALKDTVKLVDGTVKEIRENESKGYENDKKEGKGAIEKKAEVPLKKDVNQSNQVIHKQAPEVAANHNDKILELHRQGMSVVEISKSLGLGQGEVKLVLDLFVK